MDWLLLVGAFAAGLVDAVVGGGGLVQIPLLFSVYPGLAPGALFGTNKLSSVFGTGMAALRFSRRIELPWGIAVPCALAAFFASFAGAAAVVSMATEVIKPVVLTLLVVVALYTFVRKDLGRSAQRRRAAAPAPSLSAIGVGGSLGFYDGFFGPGTGSFLIFIFVRYFGLDFLRASAVSKVVNAATNLGALAYFLPRQDVLVVLGLGMAMFNVIGALCGVQLALRYGSEFVRRVFLAIVFVLILRFAWDLFG